MFRNFIIFSTFLYLLNCFCGNAQQKIKNEQSARLDTIQLNDTICQQNITTLKNQKRNSFSGCNETATVEIDSFFLAFNCLKIGLTVDSLTMYFGQPDSETSFILGGIDGEFKKEIEYKDVGCKIGISARDTIISIPKVIYFWLFEQCKLVTIEEIGIGTTSDKINSILSGYIREVDEKRIFIGDVYYGTVFFMDNDKVIKIYVGQLSE